MFGPGLWGQCREPGQVWAGDQVPATPISTRCRYLGNRGGEISILDSCFSCPSPPIQTSNPITMKPGKHETGCKFLKINTSSSHQVSKTLKATLTALLDNVCDSDCNPSPDVPSSLSHEPLGGSTAPKLILAKRRANQQETETYYFTVSG